MGGRLKAEGTQEVSAGAGTLRIKLPDGVRAQLAEDARLLLSWEEAGQSNGDGVTSSGRARRPTGS